MLLKQKANYKSTFQKSIGLATYSCFSITLFHCRLVDSTVFNVFFHDFLCIYLAVVWEPTSTYFCVHSQHRFSHIVKLLLNHTPSSCSRPRYLIPAIGPKWNERSKPSPLWCLLIHLSPSPCPGVPAPVPTPLIFLTAPHHPSGSRALPEDFSWNRRDAASKNKQRF